MNLPGLGLGLGLTTLVVSSDPVSLGSFWRWTDIQLPSGGANSPQNEIYPGTEPWATEHGDVQAWVIMVVIS